MSAKYGVTYKDLSAALLMASQIVTELQEKKQEPKKELQSKTKEPAIKEIIKEKKPKKDIPLRAKNDPRQKN